MENNAVGRPRDGEGPLWKYVRLWPIVLVVGSVVATYAVMNDNIKDLQAAQSAQAQEVDKNQVKQAERTEGNRKEIELLKQQSIRVESQLERVNEKLGDQKSDIKDILLILRGRTMR